MSSCALNFSWLISASVPAFLCHFNRPRLARRLSVLIVVLAAVDLYPRIAEPDHFGCVHAVCRPLEINLLRVTVIAVAVLLSAAVVVKSALMHELFATRHIATLVSAELVHAFLHYFCPWYPASPRGDGDMPFCFSRVVAMASALVINGFYFVPVMYTIMAAMMMSAIRDSVPSTPYGLSTH